MTKKQYPIEDWEFVDNIETSFNEWFYSNHMNFEIQNNPNNRAIKKASSFNHIIPSEDMSIEEYGAFLNCAKSYELELDVVSQETYYKICKELNKPLPKPNFPQFRYM